MRNRWEDSRDGGLDDPVTLTERQLRSLKRGARAGAFAFILALAAAGLAGWTSVEGGKLNLLSVLHPSAENGATETPAAAPAAGSASSSTADSARGPAAAPSAAQPVTPAVPPSTPATKAPGRAAARAPKHAIADRGSAPVTQNFEASTPSATIPTRDPVPVSAESRKPATQDSSTAHH